MTSRLLTIGALLAAIPSGATAQERTLTQPTIDAAQNVYVVTYRRGPKFDPAKGGNNAGIREHIRHFEALRERLVAAGTVQQTGDDLLGYVIFRAPDQATADLWLRRDPAVNAGTMSAQLRRWGVAEVRGWTKTPTRPSGPSTP